MPDKHGFDHLTTRGGGPYLRCIWCGEIRSPWSNGLERHHRRHRRDELAAEERSREERERAQNALRLN